LKKEAETFAHLARALGQRLHRMDKSFLVLFIGKNRFLAFAAENESNSVLPSNHCGCEVFGYL
jgi:hypothetical protein